MNVLLQVPVPGGVAICSRWRQAAELGCKYALNFQSILWLIVNVTPGNAGFMDREYAADIALIFVRLLCGMAGGCAFVWFFNDDPTWLDWFSGAVSGGAFAMGAWIAADLVFSE